MGGRFLDVAQCDAGVEDGGTERVPQRVRPGWLDDPGAGHPADNTGGAMAVEPLSVWGEEERPSHTLADHEVDRPRGAGCQRDGDDLAAFAGDDQSPVPALDAAL
jgi:hypothetical protein